jgi:hypothetical protein
VDQQQQQQQAPQEHANMHFDTQTNKWMYENTETGQEFEWNEVANAWVPVADEEELKKQQAAYSVAGVDEEVRYTFLVNLPREADRTDRLSFLRLFVKWYSGWSSARLGSYQRNTSKRSKEAQAESRS